MKKRINLSQKEKKNTWAFFWTYMIPGKGIGRDILKMLIMLKYVNLEYLARLIATMDYKDEFLRSRYWHIVQNYVTYKAGNKCEICGKNTALEVHHRNYDHHGDEASHLQDLQCLCHHCHSKIHENKARLSKGRVLRNFA